MKFRNKKTGEIVEWDSTLINSSLVSAQNRQRLYWANWDIPQPEDKGIILADIIEEGEVDREKSYTIDANYFKGGNPRSYFEDGKRQLVFEHQSHKRAMVKVKTIGHGYMKESEKEMDKYPSLCAQSPRSKHLLSDVTGYRKLTPIECERLQTVDNIEFNTIMDICLDHQNLSANVETRSRKLPSPVGNVEKIKRRENVKYVEKDSHTNHLQTNKPVPTNVHINYGENEIVVSSPEKSFTIVNGAKENVKHLHHREIKDFVLLLVGINTIAERIMLGGEGVCYPKEKYLIHQKNGKTYVNLCGLGTIKLVSDVDMSATQEKEYLKYIMFGPFSREKDEQILQILFSYVIHVINGYTHQKIQNYNSLRFELRGNIGWTAGVSNTQRYKMLGNGWTIDVIAHILKSGLIG